MILAAFTVPLFIWPAICVAALLLLGWHDERQIRQRVERFRAVEAERMARENASPLGNADVIYDWKRDVA